LSEKRICFSEIISDLLPGYISDFPRRSTAGTLTLLQFGQTEKRSLIISEICIHIFEIMARLIQQSSTPSRIARRIRRAGADTVFTTRDFLDLDTRTAVDAALGWLTRKGSLRRLARGLYYRPRVNPWLGEVTPSKDAVVAALSRRDHMRVRKIDASAANLLGLSEQVPARVDYLTDGRTRTVTIGPHVIKFRHVAPRTIASENTTTGFVIAGLRNLGRKKITAEHLRRLRETIPPQERRRLVTDLTLAPVWMHPHLRVLAGEDEP
jgi:hypothetical protein